jgi:hypothetical protein
MVVGFTTSYAISESKNRRMAQKKKDKQLSTKLKIEQHEPH